MTMAQFGGKNPPWAREVGVNGGFSAAVGQPGVTMVSNLAAGQQVLSQPGVATPTVYSLGTGQPAQHQFNVPQGGVASLQTLQAAAALQQSVQLPQPGIAIPTTLATTQVATVSYPTPRAAAQGPQPKQRVFTGTVTKLHDNFGFVDEDVFFQTSCVKGNVPKVGDRVLVEAAYNANMPFKWNATRIQVLPNQPPPGAAPPQQTSNFTPAQRPMAPGIQPSHVTGPPPPLMGQAPPPGMGPPRPRDPPGGGYRNSGGGGDRGSDRSGVDRDRSTHEPRSSRSSHRSERSERRSPVRGGGRRSRSPRHRSRSPRRSSPPPSRSSGSSRSNRSGAPRLLPRYTVQIPKLSLDTKEANVISIKSRYSNMYIPSDFFNTAFSWTEAFPIHRPLALGNQCGFHVLHKEVEPMVKVDAVLEPPDADHLFSAKVMLMASPTLEELYHKSCALAEDSSELKENFQHPTRLIQFLVGLKGKSEPMAIGGPWSPSLDGPNPGSDPRVLINTAIRTTQALTGIDLSVCTQWYRFAEIRYHRPEEVHKGRVVPARVETVVLFLPDVWSCNPSRLEWEQMTASFKQQLADKIVDENKEDTQEDEEDGEEGSEEKKDPSHYSDLDPKTMKVNDLRKELEARSLSSKGLKSQLIARLTKALKTEQEKEEQEAENKDEEEEEKPAEVEEKAEVDEKEEERKRREEEERKRREEREKAARERRYNLPDNPAILVHPSTTAKGGKFDCTVMSVSVLLDYRPDDNKEHTFEVSLFAELFNEMLMRDSGFRIYKALLAAPDKPKPESKDDKRKKEEKKDDKKEEKKDEKEEKKDDKKEEKKEEKKDEEEPPTKKRKGSNDEEKKDDKEKAEKKDTESASKEGAAEEEDSAAAAATPSTPAAAEEDDDSKSSKKEAKSSSSSSSKEVEKSSSSSRSRSSKERERKKESSRSSGSSSSSADKLKYVTGEPSLLLSFVYFDQSHTGYLLDRDVEEILHTIGLHLSRAQVKKLVNKLVSRDTLNYRKLTDKPKPAAAPEKKEDEEEEAGAAAAAGGDEEKDDKQESIPDDETLGQGNRPLLAISSPKKEATAAASAPTPTRSSKRNKKEEDDKKGAPTVQQGMVMYNGAMLDISSVMQRLDRSEKTKRDTEAKLKDTQEEMELIKSSFTSSEQNGQKVALELQELKRKLRDQRKAGERSAEEARKYHDVLAKVRGPLASALQDVREAVAPPAATAAATATAPAEGKSEAKSEVKVEAKMEVNGD